MDPNASQPIVGLGASLPGVDRDGTEPDVELGMAEPVADVATADPGVEQGAPRPDVRHRKIIVLGALALAMALFVGGAFYSGLFFLSHADDISELAKPSARAEEQKMADVDSPPVVGDAAGSGASVPSKQASDPRLAFLLMGYGGGGHDGAYLTDSMMVIIVDPNQKTLTLLSIPRDAWVPILFDGQKAVYSKINTAYAYARDSSLYRNRLDKYTGNQGAGTLVMDTVGRILGIPISNYLAMDFDGFREMINTVGGIDVDVPDSFSAQYPANDDPEIDPSWTVVRFRKGLEHMNGERAIEFARARETIDNISEGSDFARSRRQRSIMEAFKTRLLQPEGLVHFPQLLAIGASHVDTNYNFPSVTALAQMAMDWKSVKFYQAALTNTNYLTDANGPEGTYTLVPNNSEYSWESIRALCRRLWDNPELGVAMATTEIVVENDSGVGGVGTRVSTALARLGYRVGTAAAGPARVPSQLVDGTGGAGDALLHQLESDLHTQLEQIVSKDATGSLTIGIGSGDIGLADLVVPTDAQAPSSAFGTVLVGYGVAEAAPTARPATAIPATRATPVATPAIRATPAAIPATSATPAAIPATRATPAATPATSATPVATPTTGATPVAAPTQLPPGVRGPSEPSR